MTSCLAALPRITAAVALAAAIAQAAAAPSAPVVSTVNGMEVRLDLDKTEIAVGEPLQVRLKVTNRNAPLRVANFGSKLYLSDGNDVQIMIQRPGELAVRYTGVELPGIHPDTEMDLDIGKSMHQEFPILYDKSQPNGYAFASPGDYAVSVHMNFTVLRDPVRSSIEVPLTRIRVVAPSGEDAQAFKMLADADCARSLHLLTAQNQAVLDKLRKVADSHPQSRYAPLCVFAIAVTRMHQEGMLEEAVAEFRRFLERYPSHSRASSALFDIAVCYRMMKKPDIGRDWFYYLKDHDPEFHLLREKDPTSNYYYYGVEQAQADRRWWLYEKPWDVEPVRARGQ